jgi:hypothetical protein
MTIIGCWIGRTEEWQFPPLKGKESIDSIACRDECRRSETMLQCSCSAYSSSPSWSIRHAVRYLISIVSNMKGV